MCDIPNPHWARVSITARAVCERTPVLSNGTYKGWMMMISWNFNILFDVVKVTIINIKTPSNVFKGFIAAPTLKVIPNL